MSACAKEVFVRAPSKITGAILRNLALPGHARAVEVLDRASGETRMLCGDATKLCQASGGPWTRFQKS